MIDLDRFHRFADAIETGDQATFETMLLDYPELANPADVATPPLVAAASVGRPEFVAKLLDAGADVEVTDKYAASTAVICAVRSGSIKTVKVLLDHGAKMTATDHGNDVMFSAIMSGHVEIAKLLLDYGYDPNIEHGRPRDEGSDEPPWNALTFSIARGQIEIAEAILTRSEHPIEDAEGIIERTSKKFFPVDESEALDSKIAAHKVGIQSMALFDELHRKYPLFEFRSAEREEGLPALLVMPVISGPRECLIEPADGTEKLLSDLYRKRWPHAPQLEDRAIQQTLRMLVESGYGFVQRAVDASPEEDMLRACRILSQKYAEAGQ